MEERSDPGLFMPLAELVTLYARLKSWDDELTPAERAVLRRIETELYRHLSIDQLEALSGPPEERR